MSYKYIETSFGEGIFTITLNRPEKHNAMNGQMVNELIHAMGVVREVAAARAVVLRGRGKSFSAGADLGYLSAIHGTPEFIEFGEIIQELLFELVHCKIPVVSVARGWVFGGALGLLAASDVVVCDQNTSFSFSETKTGMVPAAILPFVNKRIGTTNSRYLMLTAIGFDAREALMAGLVNKMVPGELLEQAADDLISGILQSSPEAVAMTKKIINTIDNRTVLIDTASYSLNFYEDINKSDYVREGLNAFREKRRPEWSNIEGNNE